MKWTRPNGRWLHNGTPCHPVSADYEEMIRWRDIEIDNLHEEIRELREFKELFEDVVLETPPMDPLD
jgi:hypothetical protein